MTTLLDSPAAVTAASPVPFGFQLSEDQLAVRKMVREFAESEIAPHVMEWDEAQVFPREVVARLGELGMLGVIIPESYGGAGLSYIDYIGVIEEPSASRSRRTTASARTTSSCSARKSRSVAG